MGASSSQHCNKYDFFYGLPKDSATYSNLNDYILSAPLKSKSSSSLHFLLNNFKAFSASKSFFSDLKNFKRQANKNKEEDIANNNYLPLSSSHHNINIFSKSMSLNNFRTDKKYIFDRKGLYRERTNGNANGLINKVESRKKEQGISKLEIDFSRLNCDEYVTYDNQGYSSEKNSNKKHNVYRNVDQKKHILCQDNNYNNKNHKKLEEKNNHSNDYCQIIEKSKNKIESINLNYSNNYNDNITQQESRNKAYLIDRQNNNLTYALPLTKILTPKTNEQRDTYSEFESKKKSEICSKQVLMQATTPELLLCLGGFLTQRFKHLNDFDCSKAISWMRNVDRSLLLQGWQDVVFISPANIVFVYLLINSEGSRHRVNSVESLQLLVLTCLYVAYTYMGNEISYPSKPFLLEHVPKEDFWNRCLQIIHCNSSNMLKINKDPAFFVDNFSELKSYLKN